MKTTAKTASSANLLKAAPLVVGTIHSAGALQYALRKLKPDTLDILELRADAFAAEQETLPAVVGQLRELEIPLLLTVRHPEEGAAAFLDLQARRRLFRQLLPLVQWADFEVRSIPVLAAEIACAAELGVQTVISDHHFGGVPPLADLKRRFGRARMVGPTVYKVAATTQTPVALEKLLAFFNWANAMEPGRISVMGMGACGHVSRLLFGSCGSVLNYGYLDKPQVPGQWSAAELKLRLIQLSGQSGL